MQITFKTVDCTAVQMTLAEEFVCCWVAEHVAAAVCKYSSAVDCTICTVNVLFCCAAEHVAAAV
jgi:hypothetical protein